MKAVAVVIVFFCAVITTSAQERVHLIEIPFTSLKVSGNLHLELVKSDRQQVVLVSEDDPGELDMKTSGEQLVLKTATELTRDEAITLKLHYMNLAHIEITKGAVVQSLDTLYAGNLQLDVLNGGKTELYLRVDSLSARVTQGADIILSGVARAQYINAYTWGNYLGDGLEVTSTYAKAATGAQVKVRAGEMLDATATSGAYVGYWGEPDLIREKATVGGEITQLTE